MAVTDLALGFTPTTKAADTVTAFVVRMATVIQNIMNIVMVIGQAIMTVTAPQA